MSIAESVELQYKEDAKLCSLDEHLVWRVICNTARYTDTISIILSNSTYSAVTEATSGNCRIFSLRLGRQYLAVFFTVHRY